MPAQLVKNTNLIGQLMKRVVRGGVMHGHWMSLLDPVGQVANEIKEEIAFRDADGCD